MTPDERLDALLRSRPISVECDLKERVLERVRNEAASAASSRRQTRIVLFSTLAVAASLVGAVVLFPLLTPAGPGPQQLEEAPADAMAGRAVAPAAHGSPSYTAEILEEIALHEMDETLADLAFLLEDDTFEMLWILADAHHH